MKNNLPFSFHLSFAGGSISPSLLVPQTLWRMGTGSSSCMLLVPWGYATLSSLGKIPFYFSCRPWAAGKLPKRKFILARSAFQPCQPEVERHPSHLSFPGQWLEL